MLHKYKKIALIEAEQYRGTVKQQRKYGILRIQKSLLIAPKDYLITYRRKNDCQNWRLHRYRN